jgi:Protein of unknown function (DUF2946)
VRRRLALLLIVTVALRSLVPTGFMPASVGGEMTIVICTGHGPQTLALDAQGKPAPHKPQHSHETLCPYASAGAVTLGAGVPVPLALQVRYAAVSYRITRDLFRAAPAPGATSARGPPSRLI